MKVIDYLLRVEFSCGPCWYRYNSDGYGEQEDGSPFGGTGIGRVWPLLTGERAHYALAAGDRRIAADLLGTFGDLANASGMLPEQTWESQDLPDRELFRGHPSGSAMPLVWAHAEYIKLLRSLRDGHVFEMPPQGKARYLKGQLTADHHVWRFNQKSRSTSVGQQLRVEVGAAAVVRWTCDEGGTWNESPTTDSLLGMHYADLQTSELSPGSSIRFTYYWPEAKVWEEDTFELRVV